MIEHKLTGRTRFRVEQRLFREPLIVVQVQVKATGFYVNYTASTTDVDDTFWRDAKIEDLTVVTGVVKSSSGG